MSRSIPVLRILTRSAIALSLIGGLFIACVGVLAVQSDSDSSLFRSASGATWDEENREFKNRAIATTREQQPTSQHSNTDQPVLVEMYLSQSCSSCVPAAAYVRELAHREDVVILSWHVDYWDTLNVGRDGKWKDPYSNADYTKRQRRYARTAFNTDRVYTPQAVIAGTSDIVGSRSRQIETAISSSSIISKSPVFDVTRTTGNSRGAQEFVVTLDDPQADYRVMLVEFLPVTKTSILGGENAGVNWSEANVVTDMTSLGVLPAGTSTLVAKLPPIAENKDCAIVLQSPDGIAVAARYCPA